MILLKMIFPLISTHRRCLSSFFYRPPDKICQHQQPCARQARQKQDGGSRKPSELLPYTRRLPASDLVKAVQRRDIAVKAFHIRIVHGFLAPDGFGRIFNQLARGVAQ